MAVPHALTRVQGREGEGGGGAAASGYRAASLLGGGDARLIYRHYATLYFVFAVDSAESELGILDLIQVRCATRGWDAGLVASSLTPCAWTSARVGSGAQVFVESLDKCFENVCELDLIFHVDKVRWQGGRSAGKRRRAPMRVC